MERDEERGNREEKEKTGTRDRWEGERRRGEPKKGYNLRERGNCHEQIGDKDREK